MMIHRPVFVFVARWLGWTRWVVLGAVCVLLCGPVASGAAAGGETWLEWSLVEEGGKPKGLGAGGEEILVPRPVAYGDFRVGLTYSVAEGDPVLELRVGADAFRIDHGEGKLENSSSEGVRTFLDKPLDIELEEGVRAGEQLSLVVERADNKIEVRWNDELVYQAKYERDTVGNIAVRVDSGEIRIARFDVEGVLPKLPEPVPVFVSGTEGSAYYRIPSLVVAPNGDLLAFAEARRDSFKDTGNIDQVMKRSSDGGKTWSEMQLIYEEGGERPVTCTNLSPVVDRIKGRIWLFFLVCERWNRGDFKLMRMWSDDSGRTWSEPEDVAKTLGNPEWLSAHPGPGHGIQLERGPHAGRLILSGWYYMDKRNGVFVFTSDDHGETWQRHEPVAVGPNETQLVELSDGSVMAMMRPEHGKPSEWRLFSTSTNGSDWGPVRRIGSFRSVICQASVLRHSWPEGSHPGRMVFSHPAAGNFTNPSVRRAGLTLRSSFDDGLTWPVAQLVYPGRSAYSDLALLPDGSVGCLFENGDLDTYKRISFAAIELPGFSPPAPGSTNNAED